MASEVTIRLFTNDILYKPNQQKEAWLSELEACGQGDGVVIDYSTQPKIVAILLAKNAQGEFNIPLGKVDVKLERVPFFVRNDDGTVSRVPLGKATLSNFFTNKKYRMEPIIRTLSLNTIDILNKAILDDRKEPIVFAQAYTAPISQTQEALRACGYVMDNQQSSRMRVSRYGELVILQRPTNLTQEQETAYLSSLKNCYTDDQRNTVYRTFAYQSAINGLGEDKGVIIKPPQPQNIQ